MDNNNDKLEKELRNFAKQNKMKYVSNKKSIDNLIESFKIKPLELEQFLRKYIIDQDLSIQIISTKICTHFNRLRLETETKSKSIKGNIKNNILLIGPTGVGKTYIIKLIADKLKIPFSRGDATKFSETGYIGSDVDDLVRNLYYKCNCDIKMAEYGIVYVDEIDKIASVGTRGNGPDVSRGGVQRSLLKLMEESEVDIKTPHDIASQMESVIQLQKTGKVQRKKINTKNILFVFSGAFDALGEIIKKRMNENVIGFSSKKQYKTYNTEIFKNIIPADLIKFGFESEFVGRIPILTILSDLSETSLYKILNNEYSSIINSKKRDFEAYGIELNFNDNALKLIAQLASKEKTGARALVRIVENTLIHFERLLPSTNIDTFTVTKDIVENPQQAIQNLINKENLKSLIEDLIVPYGLEINIKNE